MSTATTSHVANPIFVVGAPRSGTSVMRLILNAHSRLAISEETGFYGDMWWPHTNSQSLRSWPSIVSDFLSLCESRFRPQVDLSSVAVRLSALSTPDWASLLASPIEAWAQTHGKARWGEKTPHHLFFPDAILEHFPHAQIIHMIRDPRGSVHSLNNFPFFGDNTAINALNWREYETSGNTLLTRTVPDDQLITVRYERLTTAPEVTLRSVCDFLGERFEKEMLDFWRQTSSFTLEPDLTTPKLAQPLGGDPDHWRTHLSPRDIATIEFLCKEPMKRLGYTPESRHPHILTAVATAPSRAYWLVKMAQHRRRRFHTVSYVPFASTKQRLHRCRGRSRRR